MTKMGTQIIGKFARGARIVNDVQSTREVAQLAIDRQLGLAGLGGQLGVGEDVDPVAELAAGRIMAPIDHPDPAHLMLSGTRLPGVQVYTGNFLERTVVERRDTCTGWATGSPSSRSSSPTRPTSPRSVQLGSIVAGPIITGWSIDCPSSADAQPWEIQ